MTCPDCKKEFDSAVTEDVEGANCIVELEMCPLCGYVLKSNSRDKPASNGHDKEE